MEALVLSLQRMRFECKRHRLFVPRQIANRSTARGCERRSKCRFHIRPIQRSRGQI